MGEKQNKRHDESVSKGGSNYHYIPRFVLRNFLDDTVTNPSERKVYHVDLETGRIRRQGVPSAAAEDHMYDAPRRDVAGMPLEQLY